MSFSARMLLGVAILALGLASVAAQAAQRLALVIGNDSYEMVTPLRKAVADARAYRDHLKGDRGFDEVFYAENANEAAMLGAIGRFLSAIDPGDTALVVFSGHGVQLDPNRTDTLFLLPTDVPALRPEDPAAPFTLGAKAVRFTELRDQIAARGARTRVFVLDACRDNPFGKSVDGTRSVGLARGLAPVQAADGEFIFYAAAPGDQALDRLSNSDGHPNSVFSRVFLKHFRSGAYLEDIANQVQREVYDLALTATPAFVQRPYYDDGVIGKGCLDARCGPAGGPAPTTAGGCDGATARQLWEIASTDNDCQSYESFMGACPEAPQARFAQSRLERLRCGPSEEATAPASPAPRPEAPSNAWAPSVEQIRETQRLLSALGFDVGAIDGQFGSSSSSALRAFERQSGRTVDGILSREDLVALRNWTAPQRQPTPKPQRTPRPQSEPEAPTHNNQGMRFPSALKATLRHGALRCTFTIPMNGSDPLGHKKYGARGNCAGEPFIINLTFKSDGVLDANRSNVSFLGVIGVALSGDMTSIRSVAAFEGGMLQLDLRS